MWTGSGAWWSLAAGRSKRTCESLRAGVDPRQPLGCAKIWYLQDAAVGVDENIITLRNWKDMHENSAQTIPSHKFPSHDGIEILLKQLQIPEGDKQQVTTRCVGGRGRRPSQNKVINIWAPLMTLIWPCCWIRWMHGGEEAAGPNDCVWWKCYQCWFVITEIKQGGDFTEEKEKSGFTEPRRECCGPLFEHVTPNQIYCEFSNKDRETEVLQPLNNSPSVLLDINYIACVRLRLFVVWDSSVSLGG